MNVRVFAGYVHSSIVRSPSVSSSSYFEFAIALAVAENCGYGDQGSDHGNEERQAAAPAAILIHRLLPAIAIAGARRSHRESYIPPTR
jgi:hypothetical protein